MLQKYASEAWTAVSQMFSSQSRSRTMHPLSQLAREKKGESSAASYYAKMKGFADEMVATGKKVGDDDLIAYILNGLGADYFNVYQG